MKLDQLKSKFAAFKVEFMKEHYNKHLLVAMAAMFVADRLMEIHYQFHDFPWPVRIFVSFFFGLCGGSIWEIGQKLIYKAEMSLKDIFWSGVGAALGCILAIVVFQFIFHA